MTKFITNRIASYLKWPCLNFLFVGRRLFISLLVCYLILSCFLSANAKVIDHEREWAIKFYTGSKIWSGTDSVINAQIYGDSGKSELIQFIPNRIQMEVQSIDQFSLGLIDLSKIGTINSITVSKQHSYAFFNDWELLKVELIDPKGKVYLFDCRCWLTTLKYKRNIEIYSIDGVRIQKDLGTIQLKRRHGRIFPITVSLLFLFMMLIIFTYFGNLVFKKWREHSNYLSHNLPRQHRRRQNHQGGRGIHRSTNLSGDSNANNPNDDLYKDDEDDENNNSTNTNRARIYNFTNDLSNVNFNTTNQNHSQRVGDRRNHSVSHGPNPRMVANLTSNEDLPPNYKELYPMETIRSTEAATGNVGSTLEQNNVRDITSNKTSV